MPAVDSFVGDGLNPSPYKEALAEIERLRAERDALRYVIGQAARILRGEGVEDQGEAYDKAQRLLDAALAKGE